MEKIDIQRRRKTPFHLLYEKEFRFCDESFCTNLCETYDYCDSKLIDDGEHRWLTQDVHDHQEV
jgi:hypothetical protein